MSSGDLTARHAVSSYHHLALQESVRVSAPLTEAAIQQMRDMIASGRLSPGSRLPAESELKLSAVPFQLPEGVAPPAPAVSNWSMSQ